MVFFRTLWQLFIAELSLTEWQLSQNFRLRSRKLAVDEKAVIFLNILPNSNRSRSGSIAFQLIDPPMTPYPYLPTSRRGSSTINSAPFPSSEWHRS
jgi:hypothetical protein